MKVPRMLWRRPPPSPVLIYDTTGSHHLIRALGLPADTPTLAVRRDAMHVGVLSSAIRDRRPLKDAYEDAYIQAVDPCVILTFIDNAPRFYRIASRHPDRTTMFVQNGWRGGPFDIFARGFGATRDSVGVMVTYGHAIGAEYRKHLDGCTFPIGSILNNEIIPSGVTRDAGLAYISSYEPGTDFNMDAGRAIASSTARFAQAHGLAFHVVGRSVDPRERSLYRDAIGPAVSFLPKGAVGDSYRFLDRCLASTTIDSSLGYESVARGNRTVFVPALNSLSREFRFGWPQTYPDDGPFWTSTADDAHIHLVLDRVLTANESAWRAMVADARFGDLVSFDPGNGKLRSLIQQLSRTA